MEELNQQEPEIAKVGIDFSKKLNLDDNEAAKGAAAASSTGEDNESTVVADANRGRQPGKKNRKKNKN